MAATKTAGTGERYAWELYAKGSPPGVGYDPRNPLTPAESSPSADRYPATATTARHGSCRTPRPPTEKPQ
ncbi:hypothetical protein FM076_30270 [Streptomyces albus subsp. chlorinus]|nr:hypothetical protein [Streptomyces albus subsp. chlorinus]